MPGPFVMVGASLGGPYIVTFTRLCAEVAPRLRRTRPPPINCGR